MAPRKTLTFLGGEGAGKKTLMGHLSWKMGPSLLMVEHLERNNIKRLDEMQPCMERNGIEIALDLSPHAYYVMKPSQEPDVLLWVVDATSPGAGETSSKELASYLASNSSRPKDKLLVLINKMDKIEWSKRDFDAVAARFQTLESLPSQTFIIPVSGFEGVNLIDVPKDVVWMNQNVAGGTIQPGIVLGKCLADLLY